MYTPAANRYEDMQYRRCGHSGLMLPAISLGLWHNFGGVDAFENGRAMVRYAFDRGITHFDLANNYGPPPGSAESNFGTILKKDFGGHLRDELIISTKAGYRMWPGPYGEWGSRKYLLASLDQSLQRMCLEYVDIFYSHRPDVDTPMEETMSALATAVHSGKALYVGLSNYNAEQTQEAIDLLDDMNIKCLIHQPKYSMLVRTPEEGLLDVLKTHGVGCIPFSPLAQGLLTDKYLQGIPADSRAAKSHGFLQADDVNEETISKVRALKVIADRRNQSIAQLAISWLLKSEVVTSVLVGASSVGQLRDNLGSIDNIDFSEDEVREVEGVI